MTEEKSFGTSNGVNKSSGRFPGIVIIIILAEFCERFSYSGMRAFLTLYLRSKLGYTDDGATETYHVFSTLVYVFPIIGGILADNYLGKFRTILYMMFVYAAGNILVAITAIPHFALPGRLCTLIGLFMITVGTGGIKPCVTAFGGDQFKIPEQESHLAAYFSIMYFNLCVGSLIAKTVSPIMRSEVHCFGEKDCYSLAFGAPGLVVLMSIVIFVSAKNKYIIKKPEGNVVIDFVKCVSLGVKNAVLKRNRSNKHTHWLDTTQNRYDKRFIRDIKKTLSIVMLFTVLPVFWSLLDQLGSRWTLQATKMDGRFGFVTIKPDQMQVLVPVWILILIPVSQKFVYPYLEKRNILKNPLNKLTLGGVLAGVAFIASALLEIYLKTTYPVLPQPGYSQLRVFNSNPCSVSLQSDEQNITYTIPALASVTRTVRFNERFDLKLGGSCIEPRDEVIQLKDGAAVSLFLANDEVLSYEDKLEKSKSGFPFVRFLTPNFIDTNLTLYNERQNDIEASIRPGVSEQIEVFTSTYSVIVDNQVIGSNIDFGSGGVYTVIIGYTKTGFELQVVTITQPNSITMALLIPQFFIMAVAEVLFAVTGSEFAFKEAPESMKAVMTSVWLLTEAIGNIIIIVITRLFADYNQETQFLIYTGLMFTSIAVFHYLSKGYKFGYEDDEFEPRKCRSNSEVLYMQVKQVEDSLEH
ncbi:peptide transporter family 1-like [Bombyx mandarina]|uniref:Oligopeptide transporter 1 n=1 Tax=Bombyx mandarina TaxID=7092 RepID=A0A6J2JEH7_BOMMA|nr:peptide transporter family 1-like [Bombyx mandarina]